ncbi:MAG: UDP-N-acetylglucosamine--N-acetylmuramyl-(pentapeptide) pyrophosphoryl-undecaprenol [Clostridiales bacterium]|nr:UDP-N-acetylglucosamine--N-acetylmuramyl-(pentapeptide) pyrophosphoryl-undecaprenol [Clostridiales bacterium]
MKRIVLTGGGTAGHVTPNIALLPRLQKEGYEVHYIGSYEGIERSLIEELSVPYYGISTGKLRRYFDPKNFSDPFKVIKGYQEASSILKKIKPDVVFSKGGFVSVPVVLAAKRRGIPAILHESDMTPGLANKICIPFATKICANFPETVHLLSDKKSVLTGSPIRQELLSGQREAGLSFCGFHANKPVLLIIGGSLGSQVVNDAVRGILPSLLETFQVIHLCGANKIDETLMGRNGYVQFEYIKNELRDLFAASDVVISRAGANAICELLALKKPNLLIPLSGAASRGDQILNAASFEKQGFSRVLKEEDLTKDRLLQEVLALYKAKDHYIKNMEKSPMTDAIETIVNLINEVSH